jgi:hypothetical protein
MGVRLDKGGTDVLLEVYVRSVASFYNKKGTLRAKAPVVDIRQHNCTTTIWSRQTVLLEYHAVEYPLWQLCFLIIPGKLHKSTIFTLLELTSLP